MREFSGTAAGVGRGGFAGPDAGVEATLAVVGTRG